MIKYEAHSRNQSGEFRVKIESLNSRKLREELRDLGEDVADAVLADIRQLLLAGRTPTEDSDSDSTPSAPVEPKPDQDVAKPKDTLTVLLENAKTVAELKQIHSAHKEEWRDEHSKLATFRRLAIEREM